MVKKGELFVYLALILLSCRDCRSPDSKYSAILDSTVITDLSGGFEEESISFTLSQIADSVRYLALQDTGHNLIYSIDELLIDSTYIVLTDNNKNLFCFDILGNLLWKITEGIGRGPGEYLEINSIDVLSDSGVLVVFDSRSRKMLLFSLDSGDFINEFRCDLNPIDVKFLSKDRLLLYVTRPLYWKHGHSLWVLSDKGEIEKMFWRRYDKLDVSSDYSIFTSRIFPCFDGGWYIFETFSFGIVKVDQKILDVKPYFRYDFRDSYAITPDFNFDRNSFDRDKVLKGNSVDDAIVLGRFHIFKSRKKMRRMYMFYDTISKRSGRAGDNGIVDDLSHGPSFFPMDFNHDRVGWDIVLIDDLPSAEVRNLEATTNIHSEILRIVYFSDEEN